MNTVIGAAIAAIIATLTAALALLSGPDINQLSDVTPLQWTIMGIGGLLAFFKDFQAITVRRLANAVTGTGDGGGSVNSPGIVGVLAILLAASMVAGCSGTRAAYQAAEGLDETAKVIAEHYYATVREANDLAERGVLTGSDLRRAQDLVRTTEPVILELATVSQAYEAVRSAETEAALERAITDAALAVSRLIDAVRGRTTSHVEKPEAVPLLAAA